MTRVVCHIDGRGPWTVAVPGLAPHTLTMIETDRGQLPVPAGLPSPDSDLLAAMDNFERSTASEAEGLIIGRYLWSCLFPDTVSADPLGDATALVIATSAAAAPLQRLPWELLHDDAGFLALRVPATIAISRSVGPADLDSSPPLALLPRVLVVVGSAIDDPVIRPAAEYLALLDTLRSRGLGLEAQLLINASLDSLTRACRTLRPDVVHLIAHGDQLADGSSYVELAPSDRNARIPARVVAAQIIDALRDGGELPKVLVITACRTATARALAIGSGPCPDEIVPFRPSLAADCVRLGVPIVTAMNGTIASVACRDFTYAFYAALMTGRNVLQAAAAGRRGTYRAGDGVDAALNWAYPVVFTACDVDGQLQIDASPDRLERVSRAADWLKLHGRPRTFCGRHDVLSHFGRLLAADPGGEAILALCHPADVEPAIKVGTSRTLAEIAALATLAGHRAASTKWAPGDDRARTFLELARRLVSEALEVSPGHGAALQESLQILAIEAPNDQQLAPALQRMITIGGELRSSINVIGAALRIDLTSIATAIDAEDPGRYLVVLIDDLHAYGPAVPGLLATLGPNGLGTFERPIPFIFTYHEGEDTAGDGAAEAITTFVQRGRMVRKLELRSFQPPGADLAYQQFLLGEAEPLVPDPGRRDDVLSLIHESTLGIPVNFVGGDLRVALKVLRRMDALIPATEVERLASLIGPTQ
jgi:hypothetical protein